MSRTESATGRIWQAVEWQAGGRKRDGSRAKVSRRLPLATSRHVAHRQLDSGNNGPLSAFRGRGTRMPAKVIVHSKVNVRSRKRLSGGHWSRK